MQEHSNLTHGSLLSRAKRQDSQAWRQVVDLYGPLIAHWAYRCGLDSQHAADVVQEVFASVAKSLPKYETKREHGSFRAWLWTITSNKVKDHYRRNTSQAQATGGSTMLGRLEQVADNLPEEEPSDGEQVNELVQRGLEQVRKEFEPRTWDIFRRSVIDQIPSAIVAKEFCVSPAAVRQVRSRVLRRLRMQLGDVDV